METSQIYLKTNQTGALSGLKLSKTYGLYLQFIGVWLLLQVTVVVIHSSPVLTGGLVGTDSYMRLVRLTELLANGQWYDSTIARSNAPYGEVLHWTRPFDVLLIILAAPVALFAGWQSGLYWAGVVVSPLLLLACGLSLIWAMAPLLRPNRWLLPAIAIFLQPAILTYSLLGRADHHGLLLLVFVLLIGCMLRGLKNRYDGNIFFAGGALAGFGLWLSVESLLSVLAVSLALVLAWLIDPPHRARQGTLFGLGLLIMLGFALLIEHPVELLLTAIYDQVSIVHLLLAAELLAFWCLIQVLETRTGRPKNAPEGCLLMAAYGAPALGLLFLLYPSFFSGPMVDVDPYIIPVWLDKVTEMKGILPKSQESLGEFIFYLGQGLIALPFVVWKLWRERESPAWLAWLGLAVTILLFWPVATLHVRFSSFAEVLFIIVLADLIDRVIEATEAYHNMVLRVLSKSAAISVLLIGAIGFGSLLMNAGEAKGRAQSAKTGADLCSIPAISDFLETSTNWPTERPLTILAFLDFGPELLYRTRHRVIATPYHRNGPGISDSHRMMTSGDAEEAKAMMNQRGIDLILLCPGSPERVFFSTRERDDSLYSALRDGKPPSWLVPVDLPANLSGSFKLYAKPL